MEDGVARIELDLDEYRDRLRASLGPGMEVMQRMVSMARRNPKTGGPSRRLQRPDHPGRCAGGGGGRGRSHPRRKAASGSRRRPRSWGWISTGVEIVYPAEEEEKRERYAQALYDRRRGRG